MATSADKVYELVERVQVMRATHTHQTHGIGTPENCDEAKAFNALEAVLTIPRCVGGYFVEDNAYNQCLADVWAKIEGVIG